MKNRVKSAQIIEVDINSVKPDPNQPRKYIDEKYIKEMGKSILTEGVINPIEIDRDNIILTGEMRWRSAKEAGLKFIPCVLVNISKEERFMRQVIENIHHNTMSDWDTAEALKKLLANSPGELARDKFHKSDHFQKGVSWLADKIGKSTHFVTEHLDLLKESESFKAAVKERKIPFTMARAIKNTPKKHKKAIEKKIVSGELKNRDVALSVSHAINQNPEKAEELLKQDFSDCDVFEVHKKIQKVDPNYSRTPITDAFESGRKFPEFIGDECLEIMKCLRDNPPASVGRIHISFVVGSLVLLRKAIDNWLKNKNIVIEEAPKQLQEKND